jgi:hypothetical protein
MRRVIEFTLENYDRKIEIKELTVREIIELTQSGDKATSPIDSEGKPRQVTIEDFKNFIGGDLLPMVSNLKMEELYDFTPGEIKEIFAKFMEVNSAFFEFAEKAGLTSLLGALRKAIMTDFSKMLAFSSKQVTSDAGTTDTPTTS